MPIPLTKFQEPHHY